MKEHKKINVLLIEDSKIICDIMLSLPVFNRNVNVSAFLNGESALDAIKKNIPDIIFLDYYLNTNSKQNMNGDDVLRSIKKTAPSAQVVLLTGLTDQKKIDELHEIGVYGFIHKSDENMLDKVTTFLHNFLNSKNVLKAG